MKRDRPKEATIVILRKDTLSDQDQVAVPA